MSNQNVLLSQKLRQSLNEDGTLNN